MSLPQRISSSLYLTQGCGNWGGHCRHQDEVDAWRTFSRGLCWLDKVINEGMNVVMMMVYIPHHQGDS